MNKTKPIFMYFPTSTIWIDDNAVFLEVVKEQMKALNPLTFSNGEEALEHVKAKNAIDLVKKVTGRVEMAELDRDGHLISLEPQKTLEVFENKRKNQLVSVAVVDYHLQGGTGLEFCQSAKEFGLKTLLLTGVASQALGIDVLNKHVVDRFVLKNTENLFNALLADIQEEQYAFFRDLHNRVMPSFNSQFKVPFEDPHYILKFNELLTRTKAVEYYLFDHNGSYLFVDAQGQKTVLACQWRSDFADYAVLAKDNGASKNTIEALKSKRKMRFLLPNQNESIPATSWNDYLYETEKLSEDLFCSVIQDAVLA